MIFECCQIWQTELFNVNLPSSRCYSILNLFAFLHESNNFWVTSNWSKQWPESFQIFLERSAVNTMGWTTWTNTKSSKQALKPKILWNFSRLSYLKRLPWWDKSTLGFNFTVRTFSPVATPCNIAKSNRFWIYLASIQQQPSCGLCMRFCVQNWE